MLIVLPNDIAGLEEMESHMLNLGYTASKVLQSMHYREVSLNLPKFKINFKKEMNEFLQQARFIEIGSASVNLHLS